jgi:hypothetical protein
MSEIWPVRDALIHGAPAALFSRAPNADDFMSVRDAEAADRALGDPGNTQHCPLCNEFLGTEAFRKHAPACILARAGVWERQRDEEPPYAAQKRFGKRTIVSGFDPSGER